MTQMLKLVYRDFKMYMCVCVCVCVGGTVGSLPHFIQTNKLALRGQ